MGIKIDLHDFCESEVEDFAKEHLEMVKIDDLTLEYLHDRYDIFEFLESLGGVESPKLHYPNNSIVMIDAYKRLSRNIDNIPVDKLDEFLDKYNCL